jgi:xanthine dehydrogenase molybdopterin binding subunit/xanthine dehydrogenase small subunit
MGFDFLLNGVKVHVEGESPTTTLLQYLRTRGLTGSKEGCAEGDCGACTALFVEKDAHGQLTYRAINACIALLPMVAGREVVTVEGVGTHGEHPVQAAMVKHYGSQCGYCTPGFICSMFEGYYRGNLDPAHVNDQLSGNLCRCTGYRPIREAMLEALDTRKLTSADDDLFQLRLGRDLPAATPLEYRAHGKTFLRPTTFRQLLELRAKHPEAALIAGATEIGVEINKKRSPYPFLISTEGVHELTLVEERDDAWRIGGAATLTAIEEKIGAEFPMLQKMLTVFASRQIRSRATLAGNLVTASPIGDNAPVMLALDASIELESLARGARIVPLSEFFLGYRKTALLPDEIVRAILLPRGAQHHATRRLRDFYKVSKRRELDISIVAAAFAIDLGANDIVERARLAYGGVAATPVRAHKTEAFLAGKTWNRATLDRALEILAEEFHPIRDVRSGPEYRRGLIVSLFEKFFAGEKSLAQDAPLHFEIAPSWPLPSESRDLKHESAVGHVSGSAVYVDDQAHKRPMLEMWPVPSPVAHGTITKLDVSRAEKMPGVTCVLTAKDIPGMNDVGAVRQDETLLAEKTVSFHGHMVAVVVGESLDACRAAAAAVEIEISPLPSVRSAREAAEKQSFHTNGHVIARGDVDAALAKAPHRLSGEMDIGGQEHFYLEAQAAWAEADDAGGVRVVSSTQHPSEIQAVVSHVLHIPRNKVVVESPRMGGGFGGKETQGNSWAALVALAAVKTGRPVRVQLDRDIDMMLTGKRHPFFARYEIGFDDEGHLLAAKVNLVSDGGWALDLSESICDRALFHLDNCYFIPNVHFTGRVGKTNNVSHTAFRGFGGPQGMVVIEEIMDRIARNTGKTGEFVRAKNFYRGTGDTNTTHYGELLDDNRIERTWAMLLARSDFSARKRSIETFNGSSARIKRGIAITPVKFGISFTASFLNQAGALVVIYRDGSVQVNHGGTEMGQGLYTKMLGITMRELGISADKIRVMKTATDKVPNTSATAASSGADLNGAAVRNACEMLRTRLAEIALGIWGKNAVDAESVRFEKDRVFLEENPENYLHFTTIVDQAHMKQVQLSATGFYRTPAIIYDRVAGRGRPFHYFAYGAAVTEVEVDGFSGMKRIVRVDIVHDVGDSLNPGIDRGQIEGGFIQGMGWLTGEELLWDDQGRLLSHSASTYQIPSIGDAPEVFNVELLSDAAQRNVVHGSKAVGEPPLMLAISAREAIREAVAAFGAPGGDVFLAAPATHEAIFAAIQARLARTALAPSSGTSVAAE